MNIVNDLEFYLNVTIDWTERQEKSRNARPKKQSESKVTSNAVPVLSMDRGPFALAGLAAHGLQNTYIPGQKSGPGMRVWWSGST